MRIYNTPIIAKASVNASYGQRVVKGLPLSNIASFYFWDNQVPY